MMISWIHFTPSHFVPQAGVGLGDLCKEHLSHAGEDPSGSRPSSFRHTPQRILQGANEACRKKFQARGKPGMRRTSAGVDVDTYRPLLPSAEFARMSA
jgi:hypothetical protein